MFKTKLVNAFAKIDNINMQQPVAFFSSFLSINENRGKKSLSEKDLKDI